MHLLFPDMLVQIMLEHGQIGGAVSWVLGTKALHRFPFHSVATLVDRVGDDETRAVLLKKSYEAWQRVPGNPFGDGLIGGFAKHWRVLPKAEAQRIVRDLAMHARARRYEPGAGAYGPENAVRISGAGDNILFRLLHILRKLDPELAECVLAERSEVAAAAHRYPDGLDSIQSEAEALGLPAEAPVTAYIRFYHGEQEADFDRRLCAASGTGNLRPVLDAALEILDGDLRRRDIPEFWLATRSLRQVMYRAGKQNGREAAGWLDQIKHANVRLLVAIELEASLAGLPELQSLVLFHESAAAG